jgi:hypothetical protein
VTVCLKYISFYSLINTLFQGPICRHSLRQSNEYHVSYNLEEAARLFQLIKDKIDWSTINVPSVPDVNNPQNSNLEMIHRDEIYARRLQAELNRENGTGPRQTAQTSEIRRTAQTPEIRRTAQTPEINRTVPIREVNRPQGHMKNCGHSCDLVSTRQCCTCSGKINMIKDFLLCSFILLSFEFNFL